MPLKTTSNKLDEEKLYHLLRNIRTEAGLRQVDIAERLGLPQSYVSKYETGERRLDILELRRVCNAMGIPFLDVIRRLDESLK